MFKPTNFRVYAKFTQNNFVIYRLSSINLINITKLNIIKHFNYLNYFKKYRLIKTSFYLTFHWLSNLISLLRNYIRLKT